MYNINYNLPKEILKTVYNITEDMYIYTNTLEGHVQYFSKSGTVINIKLPEENFFNIVKKEGDHFSYRALSVAYHEIGHLYFKHNKENNKLPHYIKEFQAEYYSLRFLRKIKTPKKIYNKILKDSKNYLSNVFYNDKNNYKDIKFEDLDHKFLKFLGKKWGTLIIFSVLKKDGYKFDNDDYIKKCDFIFPKKKKHIVNKKVNNIITKFSDGFWWLVFKIFK